MMGAQLFNTRRAHRWTPALLGASGVAFWIDASQESFADNDPVGTATDRSGNGRNATQASAGAKPTFKTGIFNGATMPAFYFDGGDGLATPSWTPGRGGIVFIGKMTTQGMYAEHGDAMAGTNFYFYDSSSTYLVWNAGASVNLSASWLGTSDAIAAAYDDGTNLFVRKNGTQQGTAATASVIATSLPLYVGGRTASSLFITGYIAEMIYLVAPTATVVSKVEGYLAWKWGQQGNLPSTHQWKYARPSR